MKTIITLESGRLDTDATLGGWIITSATAVAEGAEDVQLQRGDCVSINGDVWRDGEMIANIA